MIATAKARRRRSPLLTALLLVLVVLFGNLLMATAAPAVAQSPGGDQVLVEVTALEPLNPTVGATLNVRGTVTNRSDAEISDLQTVLRVSGEPLVSRSDVVAVTDFTTSRRGLAVESTTTPVAERLAPGAAAEFRIAAPTNDLPLGPNGVYAMFVEARYAQGVSRTAFPMPWFPAPEVIEPSAIAVLTPMRSGVDSTALNTLQSKMLLSAMSPGGSLYELASAGANAASDGIPMAWLIDPALTATATRLAAGSASFPPSVTDPGAARDTAARWLRMVTEGSSAPSALTYLTPYAEVDGSGVLNAGVPDLLTQSVAAAAPADNSSPTSRDGLLYPAPGGTTTVQALNAYAGAGVGTVIMSESALPPQDALSFTPNGVADLRLPEGRSLTALVPDGLLAAELSRPSQTPAERFRLQAGVLAQAAMITLERPLQSRTVLLLPGSDSTLPASLYTDILTTLAQAPYSGLVALPQLLDPATPREPRSPQLAGADADQLSGAYLAPIPDLQQRLQAFSRVTVDPPAFAADYQAAILRSTSANWRTDLPAGKALLTSVGVDLGAQEQKVTTVSSGTVTFAGSSGVLPLTVSNGLDQAVRVGILLQADPSVRLSFSAPDLVTVEALRRVSVEVPVEVYGSGPLPVTVILTDSEGRPFIETADLVIRSSGASLVAAAIAILGAAALLLLVLWRFRRKGAAR